MSPLWSLKHWKFFYNEWWRAQNISIQCISDLIKSTPEWREFTNRVRSAADVFHFQMSGYALTQACTSACLCTRVALSPPSAKPSLGFLGRMWATFHKHIHARFKTSPLLRGSQGKWIAKHGMAEELMTRYYSYYAKVLFLSTYFVLICILPLGKDKWKLRITGSCLVPGTRRRIISGDYPPSCLVNKYTHYRQRNACWLLAKSWLFIIVV